MINVFLVYELDNCSNNPCNDFRIKFVYQYSQIIEKNLYKILFTSYVSNSSLKHAKLMTVIL